jgi:ATP-dependent DNA helicase RecQ
LWYRPQDLGLRRFFAGSGKVDLDQLERVATVVRDSDGPVEAGALQRATGLTATKLAAALNRLADAGAVELTSGGEVTSPAAAAAPGEAARRAQDAEARRHAVEQSRLEMIRAYAETADCRREYLLTYFGNRSRVPATTATTAWRAWLARTAPAPSRSRSAAGSDTSGGERDRSCATSRTR